MWSNGDDILLRELVVSGGTFARSYDGVGFDDDRYPATLSTFRPDDYEITVGRFRQFISAGMGTQASPPMVGAAGVNGMANQGGWEVGLTASLAADMPHTSVYPPIA